MQQPPPAPRRNARLLIVGGALLALLGLVAFASRSGFGNHSAQAAPSTTFADWAFSIFLVLFVAAIPVTIYGYASSGRMLVGRKRRSFRERVLSQLAGLAIVLIVIVVVVYLRRHHTGGFHLNFGALGGARGHGGHKGAAASASPAFKWPVAVIGGAIWVAIVVAFYASRRRLGRYSRRIEPADTALADEMAGTIGEAIDDLEAEPDARRAVIAAYARMERVLARHGLRREPSETSLEYLRRVLLGLTARGDAVQALTRLFEEARFSGHEIDAAMKRDAIGALCTIRDDLQGAEA